MRGRALVTAWLAAAAGAFGAVGEPVDLETRAYTVLSGAADGLIVAEGDRPGDADARLKTLAESLGVPFGEGASVRWIPSLSEVRMRNVPSAHRALADYLFGFQPAQIRIHAAFVAFPRVVVEDLMRRKGPSPGMREAIAAWRAGQGRLDGTVEVVTRSGVNAQAKSVREITYPTEVTLATDENTNALARAAAILPSAFETREVGTILSVTPTVGPDGRTIDLTLIPEITDLDGWHIFDTSSAAASNGVSGARLEQPIFHSRTVTTSVVMQDGDTLAVGNMESRSGEDVEFVFVTAKIVDGQGRDRTEFEGRTVR